jgi:hypothetical protein
MKPSNILKAFLAFVIALIILELFLRWSGTSRPAFVADNEILGRILKPNANIIELNEGFFMGRVNQGGYLGPYYPEKKPRHTIRIALVGDSFVAGLNLFEKYHFRTWMEERLKDSFSDSIQVLNFGYGGFNMEKMFIYYKLRVLQFHPDYVLFFIGMDDFYERDKMLGPNLKVENGKLTIEYSFRNTDAYKITKKLRGLRDTAFYSLLKKAFEFYRAGEAPKIVFDKIYLFFNSSRNMNEVDNAKTINPDRMALCRMIISDLAKETETCIIFVVKNQLDVTLKSDILDQHLTLFDATSVLDEMREDGVDPYYWRATSQLGHWNSFAHKAIGLYLASELEKLIKDDLARIKAQSLTLYMQPLIYPMIHAQFNNK